MRGRGLRGLGPLTPAQPPSMDDLQNYNVNRAGQPEVIWQPQYHYQAYPMAGATQLTFFQTPIGSGGLTFADTSMVSAGMLPRPQEFLITGIQVFFRPGGVISQAGVAPALVAANWNDVNTALYNPVNWLELFIGSKAYLDDAPIAKFTQQFGLVGGGWRSSGSTAVASGDAFTDYARHAGRYYSITPVKIPANQNFRVTINYPALAPIAVAGKIGVILDGFLYRLSQ